MNATSPGPAVRARLLSERLEELQRAFADRRATLREVVEALEGRAYLLLVIVFALPFVVPVSVPGSSTPLGLIIAAIAVQLAGGRLPWLPRRLLESRLPAGFFSTLIPGAARVVRRFERVLHPRWPRWTATPARRGVHFLAITLAALLLALPVLIPLTNTLPGWTILLLACGLLERDGVFILAGHLALGVSVVFFGVIGGAIWSTLEHTWHMLAG